MLLRIDCDKPDERRMKTVIDCLKSGGVIIYPTDTVYTIGCDLYNYEAYKKICAIKNLLPKKANFSIVCSDFSHLSNYAKQLSTSQYRLLKRYLPGPYTFILEATKEVSKIFEHNKKTIGYRIPNSPICAQMVTMLGHPIFSASIKIDDDVLEYLSDPEEIYELFKDKIDLMIDGGMGDIEPSTIIDFSSGEPELVRMGKGPIDF